jgi:hypothetical protein
MQANDGILGYHLRVYANALLDGQRRLLVEDIGHKRFTGLIASVERFHARVVAYGYEPKTIKIFNIINLNNSLGLVYTAVAKR